jgi:hypothetical protein
MVKIKKANILFLRTKFIICRTKILFMDAKITLSFDANIIEKAKHYAENQGLSLSRLTEILLRKATYGGCREIEDIPVSNWVTTLSEGEAQYLTSRKRKDIKDEYFNSKK